MPEGSREPQGFRNKPVRAYVRVFPLLCLSFLPLLLPSFFLPVFLCLPPSCLFLSLPFSAPPSFPLHPSLWTSFSFSSSLPSLPPHLPVSPLSPFSLSSSLALFNAIPLRQQERDGQETFLHDAAFPGCSLRSSLESTPPPCWPHGFFTSREAPTTQHRNWRGNS